MLHAEGSCQRPLLSLMLFRCVGKRVGKCSLPRQKDVFAQLNKSMEFSRYVPDTISFSCARLPRYLAKLFGSRLMGNTAPHHLHLRVSNFPKR